MQSTVERLSSFLQEARRRLPPGVLLEHPDELYSYRYDASIDRENPGAAVLPETREQLIEAARIALATGLPITCRGAGTGLSGGAVPEAGGLILVMTRLRRLISLDAARRLAWVEPGIVNLALSRQVADSGLHYAPDPSSQRSCTIGGNLAENAGGPHCLKYGVTAQHLLGAQVILPNGELALLGGEAQDPPGYDLLALLCGSEGTLAIATEICVKLSPIAASTRTLLAVFDSVKAACQGVSAIFEAGLVPAALEMIDRLSIEAVESVIKAGYPRDAEAVLLVELDGLESSTTAQLCKLHAALRPHASELREAKNEIERAALWRGRKEAVGALGKLCPDYYIQDGVIPRSRLPEVLAAIAEIGRKHRLRIANVFHAGDGNLHPIILFDRRTPGETERVIAAGDAILRRCVEAGGSITGEHGVGLEKSHALGLVFSPESLALQRSLKALFDPAQRLNPSKLLPSPGLCLEGGRRRRRSLREALGEQPGRKVTPANFSPPGPVLQSLPNPSERRIVDQLRAATDEDRPVQIQGASSWGALTIPGASILELGSHNGLIELAAADLSLTARAGTPLAELYAVLDAQSLRLGLIDPYGTGTLGGALAVRCGGGHRRASHGSARELILGLRLLTSDGCVHQLGGRVPKNVAGYDLPRLVLGSRGSLGAVLSATLRINPRIDGTCLIARGSRSAVVEAARCISEHRLPLAALSLLNERAAQAAGLGGDGAAVIIGIEDEKAARDELAVSLGSLLARLGFGPAGRLDGPSHEELFRSLDGLPGRLRETNPCWLRRHDHELFESFERAPDELPVAAAISAGFLDLFSPEALVPETAPGGWWRSLSPWRPGLELRSAESSLAPIFAGIKQTFDPSNCFPKLADFSAIGAAK